MQRQAEEDARNKQFRARQFNPSHYKDVVVRRTARGSEPGGRKVTQPKGPSFMTDDRLGYRRDVLEGRFADTHEAHRARHAESMARREVCFKIEGRNRLEKLEHAWYVFFFRADGVPACHAACIPRAWSATALQAPAAVCCPQACRSISYLFRLSGLVVGLSL